MLKIHICKNIDFLSDIIEQRIKLKNTYSESDNEDSDEGGDDYCWLSFKYPMEQLNKKAFLKNQRYYLKYPHKFIDLLEESKEGPSSRGYVLCSDSEPLFKVLYPSYIGGNELTIYND